MPMPGLGADQSGGALGLVLGFIGMRLLLNVNTAGLPRLGDAGSLVVV